MRTLSEEWEVHAVGRTFSQTHLNNKCFEFLSNYNVTVLTYRLAQRNFVNKNEEDHCP